MAVELYWDSDLGAPCASRSHVEEARDGACIRLRKHSFADCAGPWQRIGYRIAAERERPRPEPELNGFWVAHLAAMDAASVDPEAWRLLLASRDARCRGVALAISRDLESSLAWQTQLPIFHEGLASEHGQWLIAYALAWWGVLPQKEREVFLRCPPRGAETGYVPRGGSLHRPALIRLRKSLMVTCRYGTRLEWYRSLMGARIGFFPEIQSLDGWKNG